MKRAYRWFALSVYGSNLLLEDAALWILSVRCAMFFLTSSESASWGYVFYQVAGLPACIFAALATFSLNWMLDTSLMTLDRSSPFSTPLSAGGAPNSTVRLRYKVLFFVMGRILIIGAVLTASSGFLVQAIFHTDIRNGIAAENKARIEKKRQELLTPMQTRISKLRTELAIKERELTQEVQGQSSTKTKGCGDACKVLKTQVVALRTELTEKEGQATVIQEAFERSTPNQLQERFNITLLGEGLEARGQIVKKLKENYTFLTAQWAINGLLTVLYIGLLLLKMFQPQSVGIYYSARLQGLYKEYLAGSLNRWLEPDQYPDSRTGGMKPHAFAEWAKENYLPRKRVEEFQLKLKTVDTSHQTGMGILDARQTELESKVAAAAGRMEAANAEAVAIESQIEEHNRAAKTEAAQINSLTHEHAVLESALGGRKIPKKAYSPMIERLANVEKELATRMAEKDHGIAAADLLKRQISVVQFQKGRAAEEKVNLEKSIAMVRAEKAERTKSYILLINRLANEHDLSLRGPHGPDDIVPPETGGPDTSARVQ